MANLGSSDFDSELSKLKESQKISSSDFGPIFEPDLSQEANSTHLKYVILFIWKIKTHLDQSSNRPIAFEGSFSALKCLTPFNSNVSANSETTMPKIHN